MIARMIEQLGMDARRLIESDPDLAVAPDPQEPKVFFVSEARDSPYVPAQENFVIPYGIRSVAGFGGLLPDGMVFAFVLFSTVPMPSNTPELLAPLALSIEIPLLSHVGKQIFASDLEQPDSDKGMKRTALVDGWRAATLSRLLDSRARILEAETLRMEDVVAEAEEHRRQAAESRTALTLSEARTSAVLDGALDCIIGMDGEGTITEFNRAAEVTFRTTRDRVIGERLVELFIPVSMRHRHRRGLQRYLSTGEGPILGRRIEVDALRSDGSAFPAELAVVAVEGSDPARFTGYIRDITERNHVVAELASSRQHLAHIAHTLQSSLLPPDLPDIKGLDLGAAFRAMGDGYEVGGDFYDVSELGNGTWGFILGDVCGKGSEAAAITALARYTLRGAAMRSADPIAVLGTLNEAIYRQGGDRFCTAIYGSCEPVTGVVELALGGHPRPILVDQAGNVSEVDATGGLLGISPTWRGTPATIRLEPGDLLVFYSDGVTDARRGIDFFGDLRLSELLSTVGGLDARAAVQLVEAAVVDFAGELNDDLAILGIRRCEQ